MLSKIKTMSLLGLDGYLVEIQTDISNGIPEFEIVGLPDTSVKEAKKRIKAAIKNSQMDFPSKKILINLAPANQKKGGTSFDLAITIGILIAMQKIPKVNFDELNKTIFIGELSLDGRINGNNGVLPMCIEAKKLGIKRVILSKENSNEASIIDGIDVIPVNNISEVIKYLNNEMKIIREEKNFEKYKIKKYENMDFSEIKGQEDMKRALEIAAAGAHNCLLIGSPGSGKTMSAKMMNTILPEMNFNEILEVAKIHSISGELKNDEIMTKRPFRMPYHTITVSSMIGGGKYPKPGEVSLAHDGVLFLDELPEFKKEVLEALREPLENHSISINRLYANYMFPCKFIFVGSMNPCPCGYEGDIERECKCTESEIRRYLKKISGPLLDRIDIQIRTKRVKYDKLNVNIKNETSAEIRERVVNARKIQKNRYQEYEINTNSELTLKMIEKYCKIDEKSQELLNKAFEKLKLSVRAYTKILKVARTIADLEEKENIEYKHIAEAIQYRSLDRKYDN